MTADQIRSLAQSDPTATIVERWGEAVANTRKAVSTLEDKLRDLEQVTQQLNERGLVVATDLGPTGNSARTAFTAHQADQTTDAFEMPRAS